MRKATIGTRATLKINTGNYETIEVCKMLEVEVEFGRPEELRAKSASLDQVVADLLQAESETVLKAVGRATKDAPKAAIPAAL